MSKRLYEQASEPFTLDERLRRLERQVQALTAQVAWLTANAGADPTAPAGDPAEAGGATGSAPDVGHDGGPASRIDYGRC